MIELIGTKRVKNKIILLFMLSLIFYSNNVFSDGKYRLKYSRHAENSIRDIFDRTDFYEDGGINYSAHIKFKKNSSEIAKNSEYLLRDIGAYLVAIEHVIRKSKGHSIYILITGHADNKEKKHLPLSRDRARRVANYLKNNFRLSFDKIKIRGLGNKKPRFSNKDSWGRAQNRKVDIMITARSVEKIKMKRKKTSDWVEQLME